VVAKISAVAGASDPLWTVASIRPWILGCLETFGPDRCMLGTNWPIDRLFGTYVAVVGAYREVIAELTGDEQQAVLSGTARRVYRITR
jgi:predicted TIM-barrel fold metal-dependent hydrolase